MGSNGRNIMNAEGESNLFVPIYVLIQAKAIHLSVLDHMAQSVLFVDEIFWKIG